MSSHIDQQEMRRLINLGARAALHGLLIGYYWTEGQAKVINDYREKYMDADEREGVADE